MSDISPEDAQLKLEATEFIRKSASQSPQKDTDYNEDDIEDAGKGIGYLYSYDDYLAARRLRDLILIDQNIKMREKYGQKMMRYLAIQLVVINVFMWMIAGGSFNLDWKIVDIYVGGTIIQVFGAVYIIMKNLFPIINSSLDMSEK